jgi:polysaccharide biosynthesis protein PslJ
VIRIPDLLSASPSDQRRAVALIALALVFAGSALAVFVHPWVAVAAVAAAIVVPFVLRDIDFAFVAVVAVVTLLPFAPLPLGIGFNPTLLDLALGTLYLIWIVRVATREQARMRFPPLSAAVLVLVGLMFVALLAGTANGTPTKNQLRTFVELVLGAGLFVVVGNLITDRASLRRVFLALVGLGAASAAVGIVLYLLPDAWQVRMLSSLRVLDYPTGMGVLRYINDDPARLQRATGTSIDPNSFGGMLAVVAALLAPQAIARRALVPRRWVAGLLALLVGALLLSVSRDRWRPLPSASR